MNQVVSCLQFLKLCCSLLVITGWNIFTYFPVVWGTDGGEAEYKRLPSEPSNGPTDDTKEPEVNIQRKVSPSIMSVLKTNLIIFLAGSYP